MHRQGKAKSMAVSTRRGGGQVARLVRQRLTFSAVRILLGGILLTAATLKGELLLRSATWPYDAWGFALVLFELGFAGWLFSARLPAHVWWVSAACFATFATVTAAKLFRGEADCGCFGVVRTPPWVTLLIDIAALTALTATYRDRKAVALHTSTFGYRLPAAMGYAVILVVAAKLSLPLFGGNEWRRQDAILADPSLWVGQRCPLLDQIDIGAELSTGECLVVLHRHDCALCEETLNAAWFGDAACDVGGSRRLALVELPPCAGDDSRNVPRSLLVGRLNSSEPCLLPAPVVILLENGRVVSVATGRESEARLKELLERRRNAVAAGSWGVCANPQSTLALVERENDRKLT